MKIIKVRIGDTNAQTVYRFFKKIGATGTKTLEQIQELLEDYCKPWKKPRGALSHRSVYDNKRVSEANKALGMMIGNNGIYIGLDKHDLENILRGVESVLPDKVRTSFTLGLNQVEIK